MWEGESDAPEEEDDKNNKKNRKEEDLEFHGDAEKEDID